MTKYDDKIPEFSLFGGPLQRMGGRLGLVKDGANTFRLGLALAFFTWGVLLLLSLLDGSVGRIFSVEFIGGHVRLLLAIPLFFLCETLIAPRMADFVRNIVDAGIVPETEKPALAGIIRHVDHVNDTWLVEGFLLLVVVLLPLFEMMGLSPSSSARAAWILEHSGGKLTLLSGWYLGVCLPLFQFLMLRWFWHLVLWYYFLWRVERLKLHLIPIHPDRAGGLGYLEVVHEHFIPLVFALSAVLSVKFAEDIWAGSMVFEALYYLVPLVLILVGGIFIGPLFIFFRELWACRSIGCDEYALMASRYVDKFDRKWIRGEKDHAESLLGSADIQSLADLNNSVNIVLQMQLIPAGKRLMTELALAVIVPLVPLLLMKYQLDQMSVGLFKMLTGM